LILFVLCALPLAAFGQTATATLSGTVLDPNGAVVPAANITVTEVATGVQRTATTNDQGYFTIPLLKPSTYLLQVEHQGFLTAQVKDIVLNVGDERSLRIQMKVGDVKETVNITAESPLINESPAVGTVIDRKFVENLPLNGRSFQSLILLTPGVTPVLGGKTNINGEFSVNGQRGNTNYFIVDGVAANTGIGPTGGLVFGNGVTPAETTLGTTHSLVSIDALQEFQINTSTYSAEYGRTPGAQVSFLTRSGTNTWHGSLFDYFRNDALDSNNWFNNAAGLRKTAERQNDFGGTFGGPIELPGVYRGKNRTFFFFSYEGLRLTIPQPAFTIAVPNAFLRQNAPVALRPLLNAFPVQNGADDPNCQAPGPPAPTATCLALFTGAYSSPSNVDAYSIRIDHTFGSKLSLFGRYSATPSNSLTRNTSQDPANVINQVSKVKSTTIGATNMFSARFSNELRLNYTRNQSTYDGGGLDNFGGATPVSPAQLFPGVSVPFAYQFTAVFAFGASPSLGLSPFNTPQRQWNITDSLSNIFGSHTVKYGIDYRRLTDLQQANALADFLVYVSPAQVLANQTLFGRVQTQGGDKTGIFTNFSAFAQDDWNVTRRLHLSLGLRWDVNTPPKAANGPQPYTLDQITNLATAQLAPAGTPIWHTDWRGFAPRVGVAYQLRQASGHETVIRGGFGVFYDVGNWLGLRNLSGGVGFGSSVRYRNAAFPLTPAQNTPLTPSIASPYTGSVTAFDPHLRLPYTLQWNVAIERGLGSSQTLTVSYVAAAGRRLLSHQQLDLSAVNPNFALGNGLFLVDNASNSSYHSLQLQFKRRLSHGLQALASYTWSHAIDNLSNDNTPASPLIRGNADFDVRHNFSGAVTYDLPGRYANPALGAVLSHWSIDLRQTARSAFPFDITNGIGFLPTGQQVTIRPDIVLGAPIYVSNATAPGGRVVNFQAFTNKAGAIGNEPRNFVRGFAAWQTDLAFRREFALHERLKLQFRAEVFNLFNHPNFGAIDSSLADGPALFGRAQSTLNNALGGLNPLYQLGGPRSIQFALKLTF